MIYKRDWAILVVFIIKEHTEYKWSISTVCMVQILIPNPHEI